MQIGDVVNVKVWSPPYGVKEMRCTVYQIYKMFAVLNTGKYRFCAYLSDLRSGKVVLN